ncbi:carbohydrate diacid regulator [Sporolactobacillus sp. THM7-4]|nr:carbohydrate diacid regulator [Sporolactobacillus sp. THM7-4]
MKGKCFEMLDPQLAQKIVREVHLLINESILVANQYGLIIASTNRERLGQYHEGARIVISRKASLTITHQTASKWPGVRAGINLPIFFNNTVVGVIGITGTPEKVANYGHLLEKMTELLIHESFYQKELDFHERTLEGFVFDWLNNREWDEAFLSRAKLLNINLQCNRQAAFAHLPEPGRKEDQTILAGVSDGYRFNEEDILIRWGNDHLLLLVDVSDEDRDFSRLIEKWAGSIRQRTGKRPTIGIGSRVSPQNVKKSFHQAKRALNVATDAQPIVYDRDLTLEMIAGELRSETKKLFVERTIGVLLKHDELLNTLKNLFDHQFSYKETANFMHLHINTLHYRVKKLQELTGLDIKKIRSRVVLYLAILFLNEQTKTE